jgi:erythromycin esterase
MVTGSKCATCFLILITLIASCAGPKKSGPAGNVSNEKIASHPLRSDADLNILINAIGNSRIVLLGESSHGTAEYYDWRAAISKKLITEKGFNLIAVEGDYVDIRRLNQYVNGESNNTSIESILSIFNRWPPWLWSNQEFAAFADWIKEWNAKLKTGKKVNLSGLDVFNFSSAIDELVKLLNHSPGSEHAKKSQDCLKPVGGDALLYSTAVSKGSISCKDELYKLWEDIQKITGKKIDNENELALVQLALVARDGEQYFRLRNVDAAESWNTRVGHMQQMILRLLEFNGPHSKLIVWAHNTHIGDARYTDMPTRRRTNIGELLRKQFGENNVFAIGFGSYTGAIVAGYSWGAPWSKIKIRTAKEGSWEQLLHIDGANNKIILSKDIIHNPRLQTWLEQRSIGVVYSETYIPSIIPERYNAFIYFDTTHPIHLLNQ